MRPMLHLCHVKNIEFTVHTSLILTFDLCRELYKGMSVSMILDESSESVDSEDAEHMKVRRVIVKPDGGPFIINHGIATLLANASPLYRQSFVS